MRSLFRSSPRAGADGQVRTLLGVEQCLPFVVVLVGLGIEMSPVRFMYTGPLLAAMPPLAALTTGPLGTLLAATGALGVNVAGATVHDRWGELHVYSDLAGLLLVSVACVAISNVAQTRRDRELNQIRRVSRTAQEVLLRPVCDRLGPVRAASLYHAAEAGAQIGGDLYEAVQTRFGVRMIVGDVRGKGLPAVRVAAAVLGAFRETAHYEHDLAEIIDHCAAALRRECAAAGHEEDRAECFVTVLVAQIPGGCVVQLANRGHPPPLVLRAGKAHALGPATPLPPLGLEDFMTGPPAVTESHEFLPGDRLLLYTDGVVEARNRADEFFPLTEAVERVHARTPRKFLQQLHQRLIRYTGDRLTDDVAMILVDRLPADTGRPPGRADTRRAQRPGGGRGRSPGRGRISPCWPPGSDR
ncbi:PP2C family protein-serine/threonine phosphatase [Streptomyces nodosus]